MSQPDFLYELFEDFMDDTANQDFSMDNGLVCRWMTGQAKISPKISAYYYIDCRKILKCGSGRLRNNVVFHISPKLYDEIKMYFPEKFQDVLDPYIKYISLATDSLNRKVYR